jgi:CysZ protein
VKEFADGYRYGISGLRQLFRPGVRLFVAGPILLNGLIFAAGTAWLVSYLGQAQRAVEAWLPDWLDWLAWIV